MILLTLPRYLASKTICSIQASLAVLTNIHISHRQSLMSHYSWSCRIYLALLSKCLLQVLLGNTISLLPLIPILPVIVSIILFILQILVLMSRCRLNIVIWCLLKYITSHRTTSILCCSTATRVAIRMSLISTKIPQSLLILFMLWAISLTLQKSLDIIRTPLLTLSNCFQFIKTSIGTKQWSPNH